MALAWGFSTLGCPELSLAEVLQLARESSFQAVELRFLDNEEDINISLERFLAVPENTDLMRRSPVRVCSVDTGFRLTSSRADDMEALKKTALLAQRLGAGYVRIFDGAAWGESFTREDRAVMRANHVHWNEWRADAGIGTELALETHGATASSDAIDEVFDVLQTRLPVIWDTHHTIILAGEAPEKTWQRLGGEVVQVHFKDSLDTPSARHPYTYVLPGTGRIPVKSILALLDGADFNGVAVLEWERKWHSYLPPLCDAIAAMDAAGWRADL